MHGGSGLTGGLLSSLTTSNSVAALGKENKQRGGNRGQDLLAGYATVK
jgi:hypothetical protein